MKNTQILAAVAGRFCLIVLVLCGAAGCSRSAAPTRISPGGRDTKALTPNAAAVLAAKLANDECERLHKKRPFKPEQYAAIREDDRYRWGRLDPGGPSGLSAAVTFRADGSEPEVQVYFSTDIRTPIRRR
jgi:hypothetical protein